MKRLAVRLRARFRSARRWLGTFVPGGNGGKRALVHEILSIQVISAAMIGGLAIVSLYFGGQWVDTPVYQRSDLQPATTWEGPLVIQEFGSTTVVFPGQKVDVDNYGILVVRNKD